MKEISPLTIFTIGMFFIALLVWYFALLKPPVKEIPENVTEEGKRLLRIEKITCSKWMTKDAGGQCAGDWWEEKYGSRCSLHGFIIKCYSTIYTSENVTVNAYVKVYPTLGCIKFSYSQYCPWDKGEIMYEKNLTLNLKSGENRVMLFEWKPEQPIPSDITVYERIKFYDEIIEYEENITFKVL